MNARLMVLALGLMSASAIAAEPSNLPVQKAAQPTATPSEMVVPAAERTNAQASDDQQQPQSTPAPKRHARVTSCRCGDQDPSK